MPRLLAAAADAVEDGIWDATGGGDVAALPLASRLPCCCMAIKSPQLQLHKCNAKLN